MEKGSDHGVASEINILLRMLETLASADDLQMLVRLFGEGSSHADHDQVRRHWLRRFGRGKQRARVFLALDGKRSVNDVATHLGMRPQNVTRELRSLKELGLIDVAESNGNQIRYSKRFFVSVLGLSEALAEKFGLDTEGLPKERRWIGDRRRT